MPRFRPRRSSCTAIALGFVGLGLLACGEDAGPTPPPTNVPLTPATWYMHAANDIDLPGAEVARRFIGIVDEQTLVDSSRIHVEANGTWEQRVWLRVLHAGVLDRAELVIDEGTWTASGSENAFVSTLRSRTFTLHVSSAALVSSDEPMVFFPGAPNVQGVYRTIPPAQAP